MKKKYIIKLNGKIIGFTYLENADPPMGVVIGKIIFNEIDSPYQLISNYCKVNKISINEDNPKTEAIFTQSIETLKVYTDNGTEIKGIGALITGFKEDGYFIDVFGIPSPFYEEEFPHHVKIYNDSFK